MTTHIELFDRCAAVIFAKLYASFPIRIDLDYVDVPAELFDEDEEAQT